MLAFAGGIDGAALVRTRRGAELAFFLLARKRVFVFVVEAATCACEDAAGRVMRMGTILLSILLILHQLHSIGIQSTPAR